MIAVGCLVLVVALYVVACDVLRSMRMTNLGDRVRWERNRNRFGELRTRLVRLAFSGEIDARSKRFSGLYRGLTILMRNPREFESAAQFVLTLPMPEPTGGKRPTRTEGELARDFAARLDLLCRDYFKAYAFGAWILDQLKGKSLPPLWLFMLATREQLKGAKRVVEARQRLEQTADFALA